MGRPARWRLVEVGPGNGTLMGDLLRGTSSAAGGDFGEFRASLGEVCMVEVSPTMVRKQAERLGCDAGQLEAQLLRAGGAGTPAGAGGDGDVIRLRASGGPPVSWHGSLSSVPQDAPEVVILHELMDALPVHQFVRAGGAAGAAGGWRERLVDVAAEEDEPVSPYHLRFVLSPGPTLASATVLERRLRLMDAAAAAAVDGIEVCPRAIALAEELAGRADATGGASLIVDYGQDAHADASLRAIRRHRLVHPLSTPGRTDLSCGVDFSALRQAVGALRAARGVAAAAHGPVSQSHFLHEMGIVPRMERLGRSAATDAEREEIRRAYRRLVGTGGEAGGAGLESQHSAREEGMGESYMAMAITADAIGRPHAF